MGAIRRLRIENTSDHLLELWQEPEGDCRILPPKASLVIEDDGDVQGHPMEVHWADDRVTVWAAGSRLLVKEGSGLRELRPDELRTPWPPASLTNNP